MRKSGPSVCVPESALFDTPRSTRPVRAERLQCRSAWEEPPQPDTVHLPTSMTRKQSRRGHPDGRRKSGRQNPDGLRIQRSRPDDLGAQWHLDAAKLQLESPLYLMELRHLKTDELEISGLAMPHPSPGMFAGRGRKRRKKR